MRLVVDKIKSNLNLPIRFIRERTIQKTNVNMHIGNCF